jgi:hypothetical protein
VARQNPWLQLEGNMNACKRPLLRWQRKVLGRPNRVMGKKQKLLAVLQGEEGTMNVGKSLELRRELQILSEQGDLKWRQCAKIDWLKFRD